MSERVLVAAPLEPVETGQEFEWLPLHMPVIGWLAIKNSSDRGALGLASFQAFYHRPVYQRARSVDRILLGPRRDRAATLLSGVERIPWASLYDVAAERDLFPDDGSVTDHFIPHIPDLSRDMPYINAEHVRAVSRDEAVRFRQVALFTRSEHDEAPFTVAATYALAEVPRTEAGEEMAQEEEAGHAQD